MQLGDEREYPIEQRIEDRIVEMEAVVQAALDLVDCWRTSDMVFGDSPDVVRLQEALNRLFAHTLDSHATKGEG